MIAHQQTDTSCIPSQTLWTRDPEFSTLSLGFDLGKAPNTPDLVFVSLVRLSMTPLLPTHFYALSTSHLFESLQWVLILAAIRLALLAFTAVLWTFRTSVFLRAAVSSDRDNAHRLSATVVKRVFILGRENDRR